MGHPVIGWYFYYVEHMNMLSSNTYIEHLFEQETNSIQKLYSWNLQVYPTGHRLKSFSGACSKEELINDTTNFFLDTPV